MGSFDTASGAVRRVQARAPRIETSQPGLSRLVANAVPTSVHRSRTPATPATQHKPAFRSDSTGGTLIDTAANELWLRLGNCSHYLLQRGNGVLVLWHRVAQAANSGRARP
jgi:hypothetical protein